LATELGGSKEQPNHAGISFDTTTKKRLIGRGERFKKKKKDHHLIKPTPTQCHVIIINSLSQKLNYKNYKTTKKRLKKKILVQNGLRQTG
jgi:hypothetical protein